MKFIRLASIAVLSTTILAGGSAAFAQEEQESPVLREVREVTTDGQIEFRSAGVEDGELEVVPPVVEPEVDINPQVPGTTGPLSIVKAATMNFGTQVISNQNETYNMIAEMADLKNGTGEVPYVSFAQVQDVRGTNAGWNLQVSLSDFTSSTRNNILSGVEIEFVNSYIEYGGNNENNAPSAHTDGLKLLPNSAARSVMTADVGQGALASSVVWGNQDDITAQTENPEVEIVENSAIKLFVPGSTAKDATTYTSTLTWELTSTPGVDA